MRHILFKMDFWMKKVFIYLNEQLEEICLPLLGFEPRIYGVGSNHSTNWASTTTLNQKRLQIKMAAKYVFWKDTQPTTSLFVEGSNLLTRWLKRIIQLKTLLNFVRRLNLDQSSTRKITKKSNFNYKTPPEFLKNLKEFSWKKN